MSLVPPMTPLPELNTCCYAAQRLHRGAGINDPDLSPVLGQPALPPALPQHRVFSRVLSCLGCRSLATGAEQPGLRFTVALPSSPQIIPAFQVPENPFL